MTAIRQEVREKDTELTECKRVLDQATAEVASAAEAADDALQGAGAITMLSKELDAQREQLQAALAAADAASAAAEAVEIARADLVREEEEARQQPVWGQKEGLVQVCVALRATEMYGLLCAGDEEVYALMVGAT